VDSLIEADVWVEPKIILTVTADEITRSPFHTAGIDKTGKGYALRFPRAISGEAGLIRTDKSAEDANTVEEIVKMERQQKKVKVK
jgi:DNA ligase-1